MDWGGKAGTLGSQQQWMETLHWQTQHFRQEHREAQILGSKSKKWRFEEREKSWPESIKKSKLAKSERVSCINPKWLR